MKEVLYVVSMSGILESREVIVSVAYSGGEDADGNDILEFEYAEVLQHENPDLTEAEVAEANAMLEHGAEERVVIFLKEMYAGSGIRFDVGEFKHNPTSVLYDPNAPDYF